MTDSKNNQPSPYQLETAKLEWRDEQIPVSSEYDDIYFSTQHGLDETEYVFLQHNHLAQRWQKLDTSANKHFTIAETGFGTGLNFLAAWRLWQQLAHTNCQLHFISVEKHPLTQNDLHKALQSWPQLQAFSKQLIEQYPPLIPGQHTLSFGNVSLHLLLGDANSGFEQCLNTHHPKFASDYGPKVDAWFLDGFAPSKNPSMWSDDLFSLISKLSGPGTTASTFTAAGIVKRGLESAGFTPQKVKGFGRKREMLTAKFKEHPSPTTQKKRHKAPWALYPNPEPIKQVAVIGGGIAGCTTAFALAQKGLKVTLLERHSQLAQEASGNAQGMLFTKLSTQTGTLSRFGLSSYFFASRYYQNLKKQNILNDNSVDFCGLLQLCQTEKQQLWLQELATLFNGHENWLNFVDAQQASHISHTNIKHPGYFLKSSGWVSPTALCHKLCQHPNIEVITEQQAIQLNLQANNHWQISNDKNQCIITCDAIVIANSHDAKHFAQTSQLPLKIIRGQITELSQEYFEQLPKAVICHEGYITPAIDGKVRFGATFDIGNPDKTTIQEDHHRNLTSLKQAIPEIIKQQPNSFEGRANLRCTTPDYLPMVGQVGIRDDLITQFLPLNKDANRVIDEPGSYYPGLYINVAHGSKGLTSAPLCGELIASLITQQAAPLPRQLIEALNPARFIIRDIIRGKIH